VPEERMPSTPPDDRDAMIKQQQEEIARDALARA
jgi:hypothetical protein